jgi:hypothetical protein
MRTWIKLILILTQVLIQHKTSYCQEFIITYNVEDICSCDLDLDGDNDLVICSSNSGNTPDSLYIFYNDGLGNFVKTVIQRTNRIYVKCGIIDDDQYPDIITGYDSVLYIKNNGDGTFGEEIGLVPSQGYLEIEYIMDMDADGLNDLVYSYSNMFKKLSVLKNEGEQIFTDHVIYDEGIGPKLYPSIGVLNDDNLPDICLSYTPAGVHFLINEGVMTFDTTLLCTTKARPYICELNLIPPNDVAIFSNNTDELLLFENIGDEVFISKDTLPLFGPVLVTNIADFNNDGFDDYCYALCYWTGCTDSLYVCLNNQQWGFHQPQRYYVAQMLFFKTESADLNGDGFVDIVLYGYNPLNAFKILWNDGYGGFSYENTVGISEAPKENNIWEVIIHPNPFSSLIHFSLISTFITQYKISIIDLYGRRIRDFKTDILKPTDNLLIDWDSKDSSGKEVQNGIYFISISDGDNNRKTYKIIKY